MLTAEAIQRQGLRPQQFVLMGEFRVTYEQGCKLVKKELIIEYDEQYMYDYGEHSFYQHRKSKEIHAISHHYIDTNQNGIQWIPLNIPAPRYDEVINLLLERRNLWIYASWVFGSVYKQIQWCWYISELHRCLPYSDTTLYDTQQEATSAAIDHVLERI